MTTTIGKQATFLASCALVACSSAETVLVPTIDDPTQNVSLQGTLELPTTVFAENPRTELMAGELHQYRLPIEGPASVKLQLTAAHCGEITPFLFLFSDTPSKLVAHASGADASCAKGATIETRLDEGNHYLVIAADNPGHYQLDTWCIDGPCTPENMTFAASRVEQDELAPDNTERFREVGEFLFHHVYRLTDGLGGVRDGRLPPNLNAVHKQASGGPDSQSCLTCHNVGGIYRGGGFDDRIFQAGDGIDPEQALIRLPPSILGVGIREAIAKEMTAQLKAHEAAGTSLCVNSVDDVVCFEPGLHTDADLRVEPFGWKGRDATLREFIIGGCRVHFGMQAEGPINAFCNSSAEMKIPELNAFEGTWGYNSIDCYDPDEDGKPRELTNGQMSAMAYWLKVLDPPPASPGFEEGRAIFEEVQCHACHTRAFKLQATSFFDEDTGANVVLPAQKNMPAGEYEVWSDFKRWDMGRDNADQREFPHGDFPIPALRFVTPPLWDLSRGGP